MKIAVLGCGPAGLMAVHGAVVGTVGTATVRVFSRLRKSPLYGAQYLHAPIPGVTEGDGWPVKYQLRGGDAEDYRRKVYGPMWDGTVSPEDLAETHTAWDIRRTYDQLWKMYSDWIINTDIDPAAIRHILNGGWDLVINSIPRDMLCYRGHTFGSTEIIAAGDAPELGINIGRMFMCPPYNVICNAADNPSWYRMSNIYGHTTVEWPSFGKPGGNRVPVQTASVVRKPTYHACDCWPELLHVGRYGSWQKGVLSHSAYFDALNAVANLDTEGQNVASAEAEA